MGFSYNFIWDLDNTYLLRAIVNAFENLAKGTFAYALLFGED